MPLQPAIALAVHLEDMDVMSEAVEERAGEALRAEDLGPFVEATPALGHPLMALPNLLRRQGHVDVPDVELAQGIDHRVDHGRWRARHARWP